MQLLHWLILDHRNKIKGSLHNTLDVRLSDENRPAPNLRLKTMTRFFMHQREPNSGRNIPLSISMLPFMSG